MSYGDFELRIPLNEATTEQLRKALDRAYDGKRGCERQGTFWHAWDSRISALEGVLTARAKREAITK